MKTSEYSTMAEREKSYWWHLGRLKIIEAYIDKHKNQKSKLKLLNVGCGTGGTIDMLEKHGLVHNVDISDEAIKFMKEHGYNNIKKVSGVVLPYEEKSFDVVGAFDVLEHIEEETKALQEWCRVIKDDGLVVITVPAYQWLWTEHDVSLYHKRRYTKRRLAEAARSAGLEPVKTSYAIVFSLPLVVGFRFLNKVLGRKADSETSYVDIPDWVNSIFSSLLYAEAKLHRFISFPAGTSVVGVFQKSKANAFAKPQQTNLGIVEIQPKKPELTYES